jgi:hypothetical protein
VNFLRPLVRICYDSKTHKGIKPYEIDLMKELSLRVEGEFRGGIQKFSLEKY